MTSPQVCQYLAHFCQLDFQGEYLPALAAPVTLSTLTVGRKFSLPHLERALFLRMPPGARRRPLTCLTTAAKFDSSVFSEDREASFADPGSVCPQDNPPNTTLGISF